MWNFENLTDTYATECPLWAQCAFFNEFRVFSMQKMCPFHSVHSEAILYYELALPTGYWVHTVDQGLVSYRANGASARAPSWMRVPKLIILWSKKYISLISRNAQSLFAVVKRILQWISKKLMLLSGKITRTLLLTLVVHLV